MQYKQHIKLPSSSCPSRGSEALAGLDQFSRHQFLTKAIILRKLSEGAGQVMSMYTMVMLLQLKGNYLLSNHNLIAFDHMSVQERIQSPVFFMQVQLWALQVEPAFGKVGCWPGQMTKSWSFIRAEQQQTVLSLGGILYSCDITVGIYLALLRLER